MTTVTNERPNDAELLTLYDAIGWTAYTRDPDRLAAAIAGSHLVLTARDDWGQLIGLVRTVSDGAQRYEHQHIGRELHQSEADPAGQSARMRVGEPQLE